MPRLDVELLLHRLFRRAGARPGGAVADGVLLERFGQTRDETAFTALVERHGPMVFGVCRRVLGHHQDAEDAFQAVFLILARRAAQRARVQSVAAWLHTVASRLALRARANARPPTAEGRNLDMLPASPDTAAVWRDLRPILDEELERLPEKYRAPVVLCYLEGRTHAEAADQLGWPLGTVAGRLARARSLLRARLTRRGVTLSAALLGTVLAEHAAATALPAGLASAAVRGAAAFALASTAGISAKVVALAEGGLQAMVTAKVRLVGLVLAMLCVTAGASAWAFHAASAKSMVVEEPQRVAEEKPAAKDRYGDPLPEGAVARLGTARLRRSGEGRFLFSPDGELLASAQESDAIVVYKVRTGERLHTLHGFVRQLAPVGFSPDSRYLYTQHHFRAVEVWDMTNGQKVSAKHPPTQSDLAGISPDGKLLVFADEKTTHLHDTETLNEVCRLEDFPPRRPVVFSPDARLIVSCISPKDGKGMSAIWLWDAATGKKLQRIAEVAEAHDGFAFSWDGKLLASGTVTGIHVWDLARNQERHRFPGQTTRTRLDEIRDWQTAFSGGRLAFSRDNQTLVATGYEQPIRVWDVVKGRELRTMSDWRGGTAVSPDARFVAKTANHSLRIWDTASGNELHSAEGHDNRVRALAFSQDDATATSLDMRGQLRVWEVATGRPLGRARVIVRYRLDPSSLMWSYHLSRDGKLLAMAGGKESNGAISLYDNTLDIEVRRILLPDFREEDQVHGWAFSPDGSVLAITYGNAPNSKESWTGQLGLWNTATGAVLWRKPVTGMCHHLTFSRDGRLLTFANPRESVPTFRTWDTAEGREVSHFEGKGKLIRGFFDAMAISPDGRLLVALCSSYPGAAKHYAVHLSLYETVSGQEIAMLHGHIGRVDQIAFAPDGRTFASAHHEAETTQTKPPSLHVWDVATCQKLASLRGHEGAIESLTYSNDNRLLLSGSRDTTLLVWDVAKLLLLPPRARPAPTAQEVEASWVALAGDANAAHRAIATLATAPNLTVPLLRERLKPAEVTQPEPLRAIRAVAVLERIGTSEARAVLKTLSGGDAAARLTREANAALRFLERKTAK